MFYSCTTQDYQQCFTFQTNYCQDFSSSRKLHFLQPEAFLREGVTAINICYPYLLTSGTNC